MTAIDFHALEQAAGVAFQHDWQRKWIIRAIRESIEQYELLAQTPTPRNLAESRWKPMCRHAEALAELLGDDPAPLLEYPLFSDWGEERISRDRLRAELQSLACRAKGLMNAKLLKGPRHGYINLALAREAVEIFHRSGGTGSVKYAEGKDYGDLLDFTDKMFAVAKRFAPEHPWPKRSTIASFLKKARREEKAREREADLMQKKCV